MEEKIIQILAEVKGDQELTDNTSIGTAIMDDIGLDSLQMINFMLRIEDEFGIEIDFEKFDLSDLGTISSFSNYISGLQGLDN